MQMDDNSKITINFSFFLQLNTFTNNNHHSTTSSTSTLSKSSTLPTKKSTAPFDQSIIEKKQKFHSLRPPKKPPRTHILDAPQKEGDKENIGPEAEEEPTYDTPSNIMCTDINLPPAIDDLVCLNPLKHFLFLSRITLRTIFTNHTNYY